MTLEHDLLQLARDAMLALMNGRHFGTGQTGHYLNIISRIEDELNRPKPEFDTPESHVVKWSIPVDLNNFGEPLAQPKQQFYPDWDMLQPYHERIKELEAELAKREQEPFKPDWVSYRQGLVDGAAQPEQEPVAYLYHDASCAALANSLAHSTLLVLACDRKPSYRNETPLYTAPPRKPQVGLTDDYIVEAWGNTPMMLNARDGGSRKMFARAIEAALKEKNNAV